jgi:hypothetical protein
MAIPESVPEARIRALEAYEQIRQLAARYAHALDSRDIDQLTGLFVEDVRTTGGGVGRAALADSLDAALRRFTTTFHLIGNHIIDLVDDDHATGVVYCRPEYEVGELWIVMPLQYWDSYERRDGRWYFESRSIHAFYAADVTENPAALRDRFHFPGNPILAEADLPERWESWQRFWAADPPAITR